MFACNEANVETVISVDSHTKWIEKVQASIEISSSKLLIEYCDIGPVGEWGFPLGLDKMKNFWSYMVTPWEAARRENVVPDTILIDGRFRVATFLYSLISSRPGTTIMFDDYFDRPYYSVVEDFCLLKERHGRMAIFHTMSGYSYEQIAAKIAQYSINPK